MVRAIYAGKAGLIVLSTVTVDGLLLSRGIMFRPTFAGIVEASDGWAFPRFEYGGDSGSIGILTWPARSSVERGQDLHADVRGVMARERVEIRFQVGQLNLGGVLAIGQPGQPVLGVPTPHLQHPLIASITPVYYRSKIVLASSTAWIAGG